MLTAHLRRQVVVEPTSIAFELRGCGRTGMLPSTCHSASGGRALVGMQTADPRRPDPGGFPRVGTARCDSGRMASVRWRVERPRPGRVLKAPRWATGSRRLPRLRHDAMCLRTTCHPTSAGPAPWPRVDPAPPGRQGFQRPGSARHGVSESDMPRPERGIDPIAGLVAVHRRREYRRAGLASRQPFRSRWLGVRDCPGGRDEASRPRRTQPKVVHLPACSPWLRTDGNAPWGIPESLSPLNVEVAVARRR
jgi:hypothetical protein